jgi:hypothetical protein
VPDHDAFGREIGEDSLAGLRGDAHAVAAPATRPEEPEAPPAPSERRGAAPLGVALLVVAALGLGAVLVVLSVDTGEESLPAATSTGTAADAPGGRAPRGLGRGSLLRPRAFAGALARLRGERLGRVQSIRLAPDRVDAQLLGPDGRLRAVQVRSGAELAVLSISEAGPQETVAFRRIDASAPQRLVRAAAERLGRRPATIDYLVLTPSGRAGAWAAYFRSGEIVAGDSSGRVTRRIA